MCNDNSVFVEAVIQGSFLYSTVDWILQNWFVSAAVPIYNRLAIIESHNSRQSQNVTCMLMHVHLHNKHLAIYTQICNVVWDFEMERVYVFKSGLCLTWELTKFLIDLDFMSEHPCMAYDLFSV